MVVPGLAKSLHTHRHHALELFHCYIPVAAHGPGSRVGSTHRIHLPLARTLRRLRARVPWVATLVTYRTPGVLEHPERTLPMEQHAAAVRGSRGYLRSHEESRLLAVLHAADVPAAMAVRLVVDECHDVAAPHQPDRAGGVLVARQSERVATTDRHIVAEIARKIFACQVRCGMAVLSVDSSADPAERRRCSDRVLG